LEEFSMINVTDAARDKLSNIIAAQPTGDLALRLSIMGRGVDSFAYDFKLIKESMQQPGDVVVDTGPFKVLVDAQSAPTLEDATVVYDEEGNAFKIENPNPVWEDEVGRKVAKVIVEQINPSIAGHGGAILPVDVRDGVVYVRMMGGCQGCGMAPITLTAGVETAIKQAVPEITEIVDITHHAAGVNPYYK
jgi:Fe/S biogenesis protein NfuA